MRCDLFALARAWQKPIASILLVGVLTCPMLQSWADNFDTDLDSNSITSLEDLKPNQPKETTLSPEWLEQSTGDVIKAGVQVEQTLIPQVQTCSSGDKTQCVKIPILLVDWLVAGYSPTGQIVEGLVTEDIRWEGKTLIPKESKIVGRVVTSLSRKDEDGSEKGAKNNKLEIQFESIWLTALESMPINLTWKMEDSSLIRLGRLVKEGAIGAGKGSIGGAIAGLRAGGLQGAASTYGATLIAGAGIGAILGARKQLKNTDNTLFIDENADLTLLADPHLLVPMMTYQPNTGKVINDGVKLKILSSQLANDPFGSKNQLNVKFELENHMGFPLGTMNIALLDDFGGRCYISPFGNSGSYAQKFPPLQKREQQLTFSIKSPQLRYNLVVFNPKQPQQQLAKIPVSITQ